MLMVLDCISFACLCVIKGNVMGGVLRFGVGQEVEVQGLDGCWTVGTVVAVREAALNRSYEVGLPAIGFKYDPPCPHGLDSPPSLDNCVLSFQLLVRRQKWDSRFDEWIMESSCFVTKRGQHLAAEGNAPPVHMPNTKRPLNTRSVAYHSPAFLIVVVVLVLSV